jgi:hypothetical protein
VFTNGMTIHTTAGAANTVVGSYEYGDMVTILETTSVNGVAWGRTDKGWICMDYVQLVATPDVEPDQGTTETTAPEETTEETTAPEETTEQTTAPEETEPAAAFDFTYEEYVAAMNAELAAHDIVAKAVDGGVENAVCYEFVAISDNGSYGVVMYIELAEDGKKAAGITMLCDAADENGCENLSVFATYAMVFVDDTITDADLQNMMSQPQEDEEGNLYYIMQRASGEFAFVVSEELLQFYMYPISE